MNRPELGLTERLMWLSDSSMSTRNWNTKIKTMGHEKGRTNKNSRPHKQCLLKCIHAASPSTLFDGSVMCLVQTQLFAYGNMDCDNSIQNVGTVRHKGEVGTHMNPKQMSHSLLPLYDTWEGLPWCYFHCRHFYSIFRRDQKNSSRIMLVSVPENVTLPRKSWHLRL